MGILLSLGVIAAALLGVVLVQLNRDLKDLAEYELMLIEALE